MNLQALNSQSAGQACALSPQTRKAPEVYLPAPGINRCEFEQLLQRAMEILNARDLAAQLRVPSSSSGASA